MKIINDYELAVHINIQSKKRLGRCDLEALSELEKEHISAITVVSIVQANCARTMAHRSVLSSIFDGTEPELDMALNKACKAGFIYLTEDEFHSKEAVYRLNYDHVDLPKRAYPEYTEWECLF